jgi:hypothetical protein
MVGWWGIKTGDETMRYISEAAALASMTLFIGTLLLWAAILEVLLR